MRKTYKYRIYPTRNQQNVLKKTLEECRLLYNQFLAKRRNAWQDEKRGVSCYDQHAQLPRFKSERPALKDVYSQVLQNVAVRVDLAFKAFFRRCKSGETPGYPRFKGPGQYDSFTYPQCPDKGGPLRFVDDDHIRLAKIGVVKIKKHRDFKGKPKTITVQRTSTGKWFLTISCDNVQAKKLRKSKSQVGIDVGINSFAMLSNGDKIDNPRFFRSKEKSLATSQRKHSNVKTKKTRKVVARIHERIANKRHDFCHQQSKKIVDKFGTICVEDLNIKNMIVKGKKPKLSKSISDVAWGMFLSLLFFKAENAGRKVAKINPAYTTQDCSNCGNRQVMKLSDRKYECPKCGISMDRDLNAAKNILSVGLHTLAIA